MADITATGGASGGGHQFSWELHFDDSANTVSITTTYTRMNGQPAAGPPQEASITVQLNSSVDITVNCLTGRLDNNQAFEQGNPGSMLNTTKTRTNVRLRVSADRAAALAFSTQFTPPA